jgi:hypothetical protein
MKGLIMSELYTNDVNIEKFVTADLVKRGKYYFVDILYLDGTKDTNFKFTERANAENFLNYCYEKYSELYDESKYTSADLCFAGAIGLVIGLTFSLLI